MDTSNSEQGTRGGAGSVNPVKVDLSEGIKDTLLASVKLNEQSQKWKYTQKWGHESDSS